MCASYVIFIHAATLSRCQERVDEYLELIKNSGLIDVVREIFIDVVGNGDLPDVSSYNDSRIHVQRIHDNLGENEAPTHKHMWDYAQANKNDFILYLHTKGVGKEINPAIEDWVSYMTYFLIENWKVCINYLESNKTVGVDLRPDFHLHYSGNFWWARADYLGSLINPLEYRDVKKYPNALNSARHNQEFWICSDGTEEGHINLHNSKIPVCERHKFRYPRQIYAFDK